MMGLWSITIIIILMKGSAFGLETKCIVTFIITNSMIIINNNKSKVDSFRRIERRIKRLEYRKVTIKWSKLTKLRRRILQNKKILVGYNLVVL